MENVKELEMAELAAIEEALKAVSSHAARRARPATPHGRMIAA